MCVLSMYIDLRIDRFVLEYVVDVVDTYDYGSRDTDKIQIFNTLLLPNIYISLSLFLSIQSFIITDHCPIL